MRAWRKEAVKGRSGAITSWRLVAGRAAERVRLNLGNVTEDTAERCRAGMQAEEARTFGSRQYDQALRFGGDTETLVAWLLDDPATADPFADAKPDYGALTVSEYFQGQYWPARTNPSSPIGVAENTATVELVYWRQPSKRGGILDGPIGATRLRDLTDQLYESWQQSLTLTGRGKALRRNAYATMLSWARRQGHLDYRPEFFRLRNSTKRTRPQSDPLTVDEVARLLDASDPLRRAMWAVAIGQGLRPSELVRVRWQDVDWNLSTLFVRGSKTSESAATIPLTPLACKELRAWWDASGQPEGGLIFTWRGKPILEFKNALRACAARAGIERKVYPYLLRHSFATLAWALDVPKDVARRVMRHSTDKMLDQVYTRPRPEDMVPRLAAFDLGGD